MSFASMAGLLLEPQAEEEIGNSLVVREPYGVVAAIAPWNYPLHQIAANATGLVNDRDPEWVHQMRIGTRRLRSCLTLAAKLMPSESLDTALTELEWLAKSSTAPANKRAVAREAAQWLTVWLQNPSIFTDWLALRRSTAEFQELFGTFPPSDANT